jgi:hypothetical protein
VVTKEELAGALAYAASYQASPNVAVSEATPANRQVSDRLVLIELSDVVAKWKDDAKAKAIENQVKCEKAALTTAQNARAPTVSEISREVADEVVRKSGGRMQVCMEMQALLPDGCLGGVLRVRWEVVKGRVAEVEVVEDATTSPGFADCAAGAVRSFRFPSDSNGTMEYSWRAIPPSNGKGVNQLQLVLGS